MKSVIQLFVILLMAFPVMAQDAKKEDAQTSQLSNAEKFTNRSGTLMKKEFIDQGEVKKCKIKIARFEDLISGQKFNAIRFEYDYASSYSSDTKLALLDNDEIEGLIKSLKIIKERIFTEVASNYTEVSYQSRSGFQAGCFSKKENWMAYLKLEKYDSNSYVFIQKEDVDALLVILEGAKAKL